MQRNQQELLAAYRGRFADRWKRWDHTGPESREARPNRMTKPATVNLLNTKTYPMEPFAPEKYSRQDEKTLLA